MANNKKSVLLYCDLIHTVEKLDNETAGELFKHYLRYINDKDPKTDNVLVDIIFEQIKQNLKRDLKKWEEKREKRSIAGKKGMKKRWEKNKNDKSVITNDKSVINGITNITDNVTVTVKDNVRVKDINNNINISPELKSFNEKYKYIQKMEEPLSLEQLQKLKDKRLGFPLDVLENIFDEMENYGKKLKTKSAYLTAINWLRRKGWQSHDKVRKMNKSQITEYLTTASPRAKKVAIAINKNI